MSDPLISVLCSSFNHEKYVGYFIESLQKQTYSNWELIIIDDFSTDNNVQVINNYLSDSRIKFYKMDYNCGSSIVTTKAFSLSKGDIIIDSASDDAIKENYFETVVEIFKKNNNIGVIYNSLEIIDENNITYNQWIKKNRSKKEIFYDLFYDQNVLFSPGMAVRREFYKSLVPMNFAFVQHQDYKWHIQLLMITDCIVLEEPFIYYRIQRENSTSLGTLNQAALNRVDLEEEYLMDCFLEIKDMDLLQSIIDSSCFYDIQTDEIPFVLACSIIHHSKNIQKRQWAYKTLVKFFENEKNFEYVHNKYNFQFKDFLALSKENYYTQIIEKDKYLLLKKIKSFVKKILIYLKLYKK